MTEKEYIQALKDLEEMYEESYVYAEQIKQLEEKIDIYLQNTYPQGKGKGHQ